ncbi:hypothetical protein QO014_002580 [Kaistia dalseonensis]|uniref:Uncharacterized protein n=1 Tax=Kaistia dalseonensis TaxID=410840 RepID=A0ABU0H7A2_9HYPH|nr:hypothetical protein [Kaistia dalseonensis]
MTSRGPANEDELMKRGAAIFAAPLLIEMPATPGGASPMAQRHDDEHGDDQTETDDKACGEVE